MWSIDVLYALMIVAIISYNTHTLSSFLRNIIYFTDPSAIILRVIFLRYTLTNTPPWSGKNNSIWVTFRERLDLASISRRLRGSLVRQTVVNGSGEIGRPWWMAQRAGKDYAVSLRPRQGLRSVQLLEWEYLLHGYIRIGFIKCT